MKKIVIITIMCLFILGCESSKNRFYLDNEYYGQSGIKEITSKEINELSKNKSSFAVFVYMSSCSSCSKFNQILEQFTEKYNISFYSIPVQEIKDTDICECVKYSPSITLYNKGEIVAYLDANSDRDKQYYESVNGLENWLTKYIYLKK